MRTSIITTIYNRERFVLKNTFRQIARSDMRDSELIVVNDGSSYDYSHLKDWMAGHEIPFGWFDVDTVKDRPGTYNIDGYNNPAYAWNVALEAAAGDIIVMLSSDCIIPLHGLKAARGCGKAVWMSTVVDMDSGMIYLGRARIYPMGWFMAWKRSELGDIRQDEEFLKGLCYEDNDFTARLALAAGRVEIDAAVTAYHQSHPCYAYSDGNFGHDRNENYIRRKWGGKIPWVDPLGPLRYQARTRERRLVLHVEGGDPRESSRETHSTA